MGVAGALDLHPGVDQIVGLVGFEAAVFNGGENFEDRIFQARARQRGAISWTRFTRKRNDGTASGLLPPPSAAGLVLDALQTGSIEAPIPVHCQKLDANMLMMEATQDQCRNDAANAIGALKFRRVFA